MARYRRRFTCRVVTPSGQLANVEGIRAVVPARDGQMGILGGHAPAVVRLGPGLLVIHPARGETMEWFLEGGFAHIADNVLTVIAEQCRRLDEIDADRAWEEITRARALPNATDEERAARDEAIRIAQRRFAAAQRWRRRRRVAEQQ